MTIEAVDTAQEIESLAEILHACVVGGASVNFVLPFTVEEARAYWRGVEGRIVIVARIEGRIVGSVSLAPASQPNQPHRADVAKLLVHPDARRQGVARALLLDLERRAREMGRPSSPSTPKGAATPNRFTDRSATSSLGSCRTSPSPPMAGGRSQPVSTTNF